MSGDNGRSGEAKGESRDFVVDRRERSGAYLDRVMSMPDTRKSVATLTRTADLSARERAQQMDDLVAQVEALTKEHNALVKAVSALEQRHDVVRNMAVTHAVWIGESALRLDAVEVATDGLATFDREQDRRIDGYEQRVDTLNRYVNREVVLLMQRIDAIERGAALLSAWIKRPFWERVRARLGL